MITWAQQHITAGTASILNATVPLWVVVAALCFGVGTKPTRPQIIGVAVGFVGVVLLIAPKMNGGFSAARTGELFVLLAAISYAAATLYGKRFSATSPIVNAAGMCTCSAIVLTPVAVFLEGTDSIGLNLNAWGAVVIGLLASSAIDDPIGVFIAAIPLNFYPITVIIFAIATLSLAKLAGLRCVLGRCYRRFVEPEAARIIPATP